jgi:hypothetical protein
MVLLKFLGVSLIFYRYKRISSDLKQTPVGLKKLVAYFSRSLLITGIA